MSVFTPTLRSEIWYLAAVAASAVIGMAVMCVVHATTDQMSGVTLLGSLAVIVLDWLMPYIFGALIAWRIGETIRSGQCRRWALR